MLLLTGIQKKMWLPFCIVAGCMPFQKKPDGAIKKSIYKKLARSALFAAEFGQEKGGLRMPYWKPGYFNSPYLRAVIACRAVLAQM
jgi:hypothetical protein